MASCAAPAAAKSATARWPSALLTAVLPDEEKFPYTMRVVSDILESNGSRSMATVCGASLVADGCRRSVEGAGGRCRHGPGEGRRRVRHPDRHRRRRRSLRRHGFQSRRNARGITALQMESRYRHDLQIMREAMEQARRGRLFILDKMDEVIAGDARPRCRSMRRAFYTLQIPTDKIRDVIGPAAKMIRGIVEQTGVKIDVEDAGKVNVASSDRGGSAKKALQIIGDITATPEVGKTYLGKVVRLADSAHSSKSSRHRWLAAHQRDRGASHQRSTGRIEGRRPDPGKGAGPRRQPHQAVAQGDLERAAREDGRWRSPSGGGRGSGFLRVRWSLKRWRRFSG